MLLFPAIDILGGQSVRLYKGDFDRVTVYGLPLDMAEKFKNQGAEWLHVVDLDGARTGEQVNESVLRDIVRSCKLKVQTGGGVRTMADIGRKLEQVGCARVVLGTACLDFELVRLAVKTFGAERIVCGIDVKDHLLAVKGWTENAGYTAHEFGKIMTDCGVRYTVYTDISRDGALTGVNTAACVEMQSICGLHVVASGGLSSLNDIRALKAGGVYGAILGKALYENVFTVAQAIQTVAEE